MKYEVRYVEWLDSTGLSRWNSLEEASKLVPDPCRTVGFVLKETATEVIIIQSFTERLGNEQSADNCICIPRFAIVFEQLVRGADPA